MPVECMDVNSIRDDIDFLWRDVEILVQGICHEPAANDYPPRLVHQFPLCFMDHEGKRVVQIAIHTSFLGSVDGSEHGNFVVVFQSDTHEGGKPVVNMDYVDPIPFIPFLLDKFRHPEVCRPYVGIEVVALYANRDPVDVQVCVVLLDISSGDAWRYQ